MKENILVIGLGLIGGSIALAIKNENKGYILGYDVFRNQMKAAQSLGVIDEMAPNLHQAAILADIIIIATPVEQTEQIIVELSKLPLKQDVIVTDVGSTKQTINQVARCFLEKNIVFIGGHPMAGSHKTGVIAARAHLFENAYYVLTPSENATEKEMNRLKHILEATRARFIILSPKEHDELVGVISHFPHIVAAGLVRLADDYQKEQPLVSRFAAGGFRDITRIASSSPVMWRDILMKNRAVLIEIMDVWMKQMSSIKQRLVKGDEGAIYSFFEEAKRFRDGLPEKEKGAIPNFYDLYVDVKDYPGAISEVTSILAKAHISITNIRIIETREDIMGVLRLTFRSEEDREHAEKLLEKALFSTFLTV